MNRGKMKGRSPVGMPGPLAEALVAVSVADLDRVLSFRVRTVEVAPQHEERLCYAELRAYVGNRALGDVRGIGEEGPQEPNGRKLQTEAQPVVPGAAPVDQELVFVVQVEKAGELLLGGFAHVASVGAPPLFG